MKKITLLSLSLFINALLYAQIWSNDIEGTSPGLQNPYVTNDVVTAGVAVSGIGRGAGVIGDATNNRYNTRSWNTATREDTAYLNFTLTPNSGEFIHFVDILLNYQKSSTGPTNYEFRSSLDGFTNVISNGTLVTSGAGILNINLSAPEFWNVNSTIEFRLYAWGASSGAGTFSINDFQFNGTVSNVLPVTFNEISAVKLSNQIKVNWTTDNEKNNNRFEIQTSINGKDFKTIKTIKSHNGNSDIAQQYEVLFTLEDVSLILGLPLLLCFLSVGFNKKTKHLLFIMALIIATVNTISCSKNKTEIHNKNENENLFIRIKQINIDNTETYSKTVRVINSN